MCDKHLLLKQAQVQEVEDAEREHDSEIFVLPGEREGTTATLDGTI